MIIREMTKEDNAAVKHIIQRSLESLGLDIPGTTYYDPQLGNLYDYYHAAEHAAYWVVESDGEVVGGIGIAPFNKSENICELQKFYLSESTKGKGLGKKLMETALQFAAKHYQQCYLETMLSLETACAIYEKYGFQLLTNPLEGSEHSTMDAWYMKELTSGEKTTIANQS